MSEDPVKDLPSSPTQAKQVSSIQNNQKPIDLKDKLKNFKEEVALPCEKFSEALASQDWEALVHPLRTLVGLLNSIHNNDGTVFKALLETDIITQALHLLGEQYIKFKELQVEASWLVANFLAGESSDTAYLVQQGCIPILAECLQINNDDIQENAMWALANLLGENDFSYRDEIFKLDVIKKIVRHMCGAPKSHTYVKTVTWLFSNSLRGPSFPPFEEVSKMLTVFAISISSPNSQTLQYTLQGLHSMVLSGDDNALRTISSYGFFPKIYQLLSLQIEKISILALTILNELPQKIFDKRTFDSGLKHALLCTLDSKVKSIELLGFDILEKVLKSEIDEHRFEMVHEIMPLILEKAEDDDKNSNIREKSVTCILIFFLTRSMAENQFMISQGVISVLCSILKKEKNKDLIISCLEALSATLEHGEKFKLLNKRNSSEILISQSGGFETLKSLQNFDDKTVKDLVGRLLESYYNLLA